MTVAASDDRRERWQRTKAIFDAVVELAPDERTAVLRERTAGDAEMLAQVAALLAQDDRSEDVMGTTSVGRFRDAKIAALPSMAGTRAGAYRLLREIGCGGMGAVYLAERADETFSRQVAVKIVRGIASDSMVRRFEAERRILAQMQHPNIAQILDAGSTEVGMPFFVMELVEGEPLDVYCARRHLTLREKLRLFLRVCSAVAYAHQNLIVHRDLKPANVLVTEDGTPKLLDFGIAKFLDAGESTATIAELRLFTPEYASPEQLSGSVIGTSTDVYSLGVILYELLTSKRPHVFANRTVSEVLECVRTARVLAPSTAARQNGIGDRIGSDLDNVVLKAISPEWRRRYPSVQQFTDDIERVLDGKPVTARRSSLASRAVKFIARNKAAVTAAVLVCTSLMGGIVAANRSAEAERHERRQAEQRASDLRKLSNSLLFELSGTLDSVPGTLPARQMMVRRAAEYLDRIATDARNDRSVEAQLAGAYDRLGSLTFDTATSLSLHRKAVTQLRRLLIAESHPRLLLGSLIDGLLNVSDSLKITGDFEGAMQSTREAEQMAQRLRKEAPGAVEVQLLQQQIYIAQGAVREEEGDSAGARAAYQKAFDLAHQMAERDPANPQRGYAVAGAESHLGFHMAVAGQRAEGLQHARRAAAIAQTLLASDPLNARYRRIVWAAHRCLGLAMLASEQPAEAVRELQSAAEMMQSLAAADPGDRGHQRSLAATLIPLGRAQRSSGNDAEARAAFEKALAISRKLARGDGDRVEAANDVAEGAAWLAVVNARTDRAAALRAFHEAVVIERPLLDRGSRNHRVLAALDEAARLLGTKL